MLVLVIERQVIPILRIDSDVLWISETADNNFRVLSIHVRRSWNDSNQLVGHIDVIDIVTRPVTRDSTQL